MNVIKGNLYLPGRDRVPIPKKDVEAEDKLGWKDIARPIHWSPRENLGRRWKVLLLQNQTGLKQGRFFEGNQ